MADALPRVVIIGGGFAGLTAAQELYYAKAKITLLDRSNHHLFQPLLYQVATAGLNPSDIASPIRKILRRQKNVEVLLAEARSIDTAAKEVVLDQGKLPYDYLIVATGATHSYFGRDDWAPFAPGLKNINDALEIRRRVLLAFEMAERETNPDVRRAWLTFVVVGGGPTGVELSGALCEIAHHALAQDFRRIDPTQARVILLEGADRILPPYSPDLSESARKQLKTLGVEVRLGQRATSIDAKRVCIGDEAIPARTVLWAAGVAGSALGKTLGVPLDRAQRVLVEPELSIPGHPEVYVVGDLCSLMQDGQPVPGVAPAAMQEARHAAKNILKSIKGEARDAFRYVDKGSLATIGRSSAVAQLGKTKLTGMLAWLAWLFVHIWFLIGFRNRFIVVFQWWWSFVSYDRGARLITGAFHTESTGLGDDPATYAAGSAPAAAPAPAPAPPQPAEAKSP